MTIVLNGAARPVDEGTTLGDLVRALGVPDRGVAVAVDAEVVPRGSWDSFVVADGAHVEVVQAVQGG